MNSLESLLTVLSNFKKVKLLFFVLDTYFRVTVDSKVAFDV